jgi:hypothetical protein
MNEYLKAILFSGYGFGAVGILIYGVACRIAQATGHEPPFTLHFIVPPLIAIVSLYLIFTQG